MTGKNSILLIFRNLRLFVNTMTADNKYSLLNRDNLMQPIQMQLYRKQKTFSDFFSAFLKSSLNFEHFQKKDDPHSWCISEITDSEKAGFFRHLCNYVFGSPWYRKYISYEGGLRLSRFQKCRKRLQKSVFFLR